MGAFEKLCPTVSGTAGSLLRNEAQGMLKALDKRRCLCGDAKERIDREREDQGQLTKFEAASLLRQ